MRVEERRHHGQSAKASRKAQASSTPGGLAVLALCSSLTKVEVKLLILFRLFIKLDWSA